MNDYMEFGDTGIVSIDDGWFLDVRSGRRFMYDEDGERIDEDGHELDLNDDDYYEDIDEQYRLSEWE